MVVPSEQDLRSYHYANYRSVQSGLAHVERAAKLAIRRNDRPTTASLVATQMILVAIKAEARLMKLLYLPEGFSRQQRSTVLNAASIYGRWQKAVELGYRSAFLVKPTKPIASALQPADAARYATLDRVLREELQPVIGIRNKLAHGQWARPLTTSGRVDELSYRFIQNENALTLTLRDDALEGIANIVGDLIQSRKLYQARFDLHFRKVEKLERWLLQGPTYEVWAAKLQQTYQRGQLKMHSNLERSEGHPN